IPTGEPSITPDSPADVFLDFRVFLKPLPALVGSSPEVGAGRRGRVHHLPQLLGRREIATLLSDRAAA
ncbi:MAG: hypothetical protein KDA17_08190, partial [Candidatus Saccharibacteria bacterium]|nr:hypothetical protein [Candidatus Saccharibacteria bacterium]